MALLQKYNAQKYKFAFSKIMPCLIGSQEKRSGTFINLSRSKLRSSDSMTRESKSYSARKKVHQ